VVDPEVIIFGGGMSSAGEPLLDLIREKIRHRTWTILPTDVHLVVSEAKQEVAGIVGAALAALHAVSKKVAPTSSVPPEGPKFSWDISQMIILPRYQLLGLLAMTFLAGGFASALGIKRFFGCTRNRK